MSNKRKRIINGYSLDNFFKNKYTINITTSINPLCDAEKYIYHRSAKLLIRYVNSKIVGFEIGNKTELLYLELMGDKELSLNDAILIIEKLFGYNYTVINSKTRKEEIVWCRYLIVWFYYNFIQPNYCKCAIDIKWLKNTDHSMVIHSCKSVDTDDKYLKELHRDMKQLFIDEIAKYGYKK